MDREQITEHLFIGTVDDAELATMLMSQFPRAAQFQAGEVEYRSSSDDVAITLYYSNGRITRAVSGPALTKESLRQTSQAIAEALLGGQRTAAFRCVAFSEGKIVDRSWRYKEDWQISPAPADAPRPEELLAAHPFILDVRFNDSPNSLIRGHRRALQTANVLLILTLFLHTRLWAYGSRSEKHWTIGPMEGSTLAPPEWRQEGYFIPNFNYSAITDDLPEILAGPATEFPAEKYYSWNGRAHDSLTIPSQLERLIEITYLLPPPKLERLLRSCFWYRTAQSVWHHSQSLYLTSLINAIECIASSDRSPGDPHEPTALFIDFMENFAPGRPSKRRLDTLYEARSQVTHGERLLHLDHARSSWGFDQQSAQDRQVINDASELVKGALINWVWNHGNPASPHLIQDSLRLSKPAKPGTKSQAQVVIPDS